MFEHQKILDKIEKLVEQLPYRSVKIEVELRDQTLVLTKEREHPIGFSLTQNDIKISFPGKLPAN